MRTATDPVRGSSREEWSQQGSPRGKWCLRGSFARILVRICGTFDVILQGINSKIGGKKRKETMLEKTTIDEDHRSTGIQSSIYTMNLLINFSVDAFRRKGAISTISLAKVISWNQQFADNFRDQFQRPCSVSISSQRVHSRTSLRSRFSVLFRLSPSAQSAAGKGEWRGSSSRWYVESSAARGRCGRMMGKPPREIESTRDAGFAASTRQLCDNLVGETCVEKRTNKISV